MAASSEHWPRMIFIASTPSISGISISMRMVSNDDVAAMSTASRPLAASCGAQPSFLKENLGNLGLENLAHLVADDAHEGLRTQ